MASTRFYDDRCRVEKALQESTDPGRYMLNVPGNGSKPCFMEDPHIRLQGWGANLMTNSINLDSELRGLGRSLNRDCMGENSYETNRVKTEKVSYPSCAPTTDQTRATNPAWTARDLEQVNWYILPLNPQENVCIPFHNNLSTRILEKDYYVGKAPCVSNEQVAELPSHNFNHGGNNICTSLNSCNRVV
tara:strand:+ start:2253 stop:2819 length:567 start_codon:yes stop_codon:yes gene_type:complete